MHAWGFVFWMWTLTLARGVLFLLSAEYTVVMCGDWREPYWPDHCFVSVWYTVVLRDFGLSYAWGVGLSGSRIRSPCLVVPWQDTSGPRDICIRSRWLRRISPTQIWVWLLKNAGFECLWCETEALCLQSLPQHCPKWPAFWLFTCFKLPWRLGIFVPLYCLWVIWTVIIRSGWILPKYID